MAETQTGGTIEGLPPEISQNLKTGDTLLLQTLLDSLTGSNGEGSVKLNLIINNRELPVTLKTDFPLELSTSQTYNLTAKVVAVRPETLSLKLTTVDGLKPETFLLQSRTSENNPLVSDALVKNLNTSTAAVEFLPLKTTPLVEAAMEKLGLPQPLRQQIIQQLPPLQINISLNPVTEGTTAGSPFQMSSPEFVNPLMQTLQQIVADPSRVQELIPQLSESLRQLSGQVLPLQLERSGDNFTVFKTPLGPVVSEQPLKTGPEILSAVISSVRPLPAPTMIVNEQTLLETFSRLLGQLPLSTDTPRPQPSSIHSSPLVAPFLKMVEALPQEHPLVQQIFNKIPAVNSQMLSNIHNFFKASADKNVETWLGREIVSELKTHGSAGREVLNQAAEILQNGTKDGLTWRLVEIPFFDGSAIGRIKVALKKKNSEPESKTQSQSTGTRFLVETTFSKLGEFQFDGFSIAADRRLDLVIRTSRPQDLDFCTHIMNLFKVSLHQVDYIGNIKINQQESFVKVMDNENAALTNGVYI